LTPGPEATPWVHGFATLRRERGGVVASNPRLGRRAELGPEAASCVGWLDGTRTVAEIASLSLAAHGGGRAAAEARVAEALDALAGVGALASSRLPAPRPPRVVEYARDPEGYRPAPESVIWEVTSACDLACAHCLASAGGKAPGELDEAGALRVVARLAEAGVLSVNLAGGEPFLRPDLLVIVDALAAAGVAVDVSTNGFALGDGTIAELAARPVYSVQVSVDGLRDEHDRFRGRPGSYDAALGSLARLAAAGFRTSVSMVVTRRNAGDVAAVAETAAALGCAAFKPLPFLPAGRGAARRDELSLDGPGLVGLARTIAGLRERYAGSMSVFGDSTMPFLLEGRSAGARGRGCGPDAAVGCSAGRSGLYVGSDGVAYPCPFFKDFPLGSLLETRLEDLWADAPFLNELRRMTAADLAGDGGPCSGCGHLGAECSGGCRAAAYLATGDPLGADPTCYRRALEEAEQDSPGAAD